jgi:hypothetical protein
MAFEDHLRRPHSRWRDDVRVMLHPAIVYAELAREPGRSSFLQRAFSFALLIGLVMAISASGRPTLRLVLGSGVAWSFIPALHVVSVALVMLTLARGRLPLVRALDLYFMGLLPWSLWLLSIAALASFTPPQREAQLWTIVLLTVPVPVVWARIVTFAFFRRALGLSRTRSVASVVLNVAIVWGSILGFFVLSGQLWPRIVGRG